MTTDEKIRTELDCLAKARSQLVKRMHYTTVDEILRNSGLPYYLIQDTTNDVGDYLRGYRYRFVSKWDSPAALYVQETMAGRQTSSMLKSLDILEMVLRDRLRIEGSWILTCHDGNAEVLRIERNSYHELADLRNTLREQHPGWLVRLHYGERAICP